MILQVRIEVDEPDDELAEEVLSKLQNIIIETVGLLDYAANNVILTEIKS